jgi:hypothetical protein
MPVVLSSAQREMLRAAIDSHVYWQLADRNYRRDGFVLEPGSDDAAVAEDIRAFQALADLLAD